MKIDYPVKDHRVSHPFGRDCTDDPIYGEFYKLFDNKHCGTDFPVPEGSEVYAAHDGIVVRREKHFGMGNVIGIRNGNIVTLYAHLNKFLTSLGKIVKSGQLIGLSGWTGDHCPTPHLHFEIREITKSTLKEMVFAPHFGAELKNYQKNFYYTVNNKNTVKTWKTLAKLFYGTKNLWRKIKNANGLDFNEKQTLPDGTKLLIPNYI